jgi:hypothetical protein
MWAGNRELRIPSIIIGHNHYICDTKSHWSRCNQPRRIGDMKRQKGLEEAHNKDMARESRI